jgi:hypothetical protein
MISEQGNTMKRKRRRPPPGRGLKPPVKKYEDTHSGEDAILKWLKEQGAKESRTYDEETGAPMRTFTIKL